MNDLVIETNDLTKCYGEQVCVAQLCLHVPKGKIYALLGRNGAGKTTTMKMLLNLVKPTSGFIKIFNDIHLEDASKAYSRIGALIETPGFYDNLTGRENLEIIARLRGLNSIESVDQALSVVNLDKNDKKIFEKYSLGMKQRLGIAAAIMHKPEILILDEPTAGLDPKERVRFRNVISSLGKNRMVLLSTHIVSDIDYIADRILIMKNGELIQEGTEKEITDKVEGCVWKCIVSEKEAGQITSSFIVSNMRSSGENVELRIVSERQQVAGAENVESTLEDAYLYHTQITGGEKNATL